MNRNVEAHFSELPKVDIQRSIFDRSSSHKTSFNTGELIPFYVDEVLPGDTFNVTTSCIVRLQTPLTPIMDNMYMDTYFFFVPNRLLWTHWKEFMGENTESAWIPETEYTIPMMVPPENGYDVGTLADYFGIPPKVGSPLPISSQSGLQFSQLPFRAYALICDQWFRDQNLTDPLSIFLGDTYRVGSNGSNYITDVELGGRPFKVSKYHDYFTSCLPAPQKGATVGLFPDDISKVVGTAGVGSVKSVFAPVVTRNQSVANNNITMKAYEAGTENNVSLSIIGMQSDTPRDIKYGMPSGYNGIIPSNLWTDMSGLDITINDLRMSFQLQKYLEKNARAGSRYREILKEHFGVTSSDARMHIPEYLGGHRFPLSIHQVANQAQGENEFLGELGAMSNTSDVHSDFVKSFEEHGYVIGVCCVRYDHSYPQGLDRFWQRKRKLDFYYPVFANIGEQPVWRTEIFYEEGTLGKFPFGYQEPWAEYRYKNSKCSSEMRPGVPNSLASWHLADYYADVENAPELSDGWIREDKNNVDRVLAVKSDVANQVFCDFYVKNIATRPMPMYSIPGLIDHH